MEPITQTPNSINENLLRLRLLNTKYSKTNNYDWQQFCQLSNIDLQRLKSSPVMLRHSITISPGHYSDFPMFDLQSIIPNSLEKSAVIGLRDSQLIFLYRSLNNGLSKYFKIDIILPKDILDHKTLYGFGPKKTTYTDNYVALDDFLRIVPPVFEYIKRIINLEFPTNYNFKLVAIDIIDETSAKSYQNRIKSN